MIFIKMQSDSLVALGIKHIKAFFLIMDLLVFSNEQTVCYAFPEQIFHLSLMYFMLPTF